MSARIPEGRCWWSLKTFRENQIRGKSSVEASSLPAYSLSRCKILLAFTWNYNASCLMASWRVWINTDMNKNKSTASSDRTTTIYILPLSWPTRICSRSSTQSFQICLNRRRSTFQKWIATGKQSCANPRWNEFWKPSRTLRGDRRPNLLPRIHYRLAWASWF